MKRHSKAEQQKEAIDTSEKLSILLNIISKDFIPPFCPCVTVLQLPNVARFQLFTVANSQYGRKLARYRFFPSICIDEHPSY